MPGMITLRGTHAGVVRTTFANLPLPAVANGAMRLCARPSAHVGPSVGELVCGRLDERGRAATAPSNKSGVASNAEPIAA